MKLNKAQIEILKASVFTLMNNNINKPITVAYDINEVRMSNYAKAYKKYCEDMQKLEDAGFITRVSSARQSCFAYMNIEKVEEIKNLL